MKTIAIIDDDVHIGNMLAEMLTQEGYAVLRAYSGTEALFILSNSRPDLVLLDLMLPGLPGEEVLSHVKGTPVIVLSAKAEVQDKVDLLLGGAADYLTKPFDTRELLARISVQLRSAAAPEGCILEAGDLRLNEITRETTVCDAPVKLTKTEFAILKLLMSNPNQVFARGLLLEKIAEDTPDCTEGSLKQHVSNLRRKLRDAGGKDYIESVWGIGFKLTKP